MWRGGRQHRREATKRATLCLCPCYWYLLCRVDRIAHLSRCRAKTIKGWNKKLNSLLHLRKKKVKKWFKMQKRSAKTSKMPKCPPTTRLADISYCTQLFHRLCCEMFRKTGICTAISWVEPRRLLLPAGKIERLYALVLVSHVQWSAGVKVQGNFHLRLSILQC